MAFIWCATILIQKIFAYSYLKKKNPRHVCQWVFLQIKNYLMVAKIMGIITKPIRLAAAVVMVVVVVVVVETKCFSFEVKKKISYWNMNFLLMQMVLELSQYKEVRRGKILWNEMLNFWLCSFIYRFSCYGFDKYFPFNCLSTRR